MVGSPSYDRYGKRGLEGLLAPYGDARSDRALVVPPHAIDLLFLPGPRVREAQRNLGLLGELIQHPTLLEPFSTRPRLDVLSGCLLKLHGLWAELRRAARRRRRSLRRAGAPSITPSQQKAANEARRPGLVLFVPQATAPFVQLVCSSPARLASKLASLGLKGVYATSRLHRTTLVVCDELPEESRTLFVRLLFGRGQTLLRAWKEFEAGYKDQEIFRYLLKQARSYSIMLEGQRSLSPDQQEQRKEYRMLWSTLTYDYYQEKVDRMEDTIQQQARQLEDQASRAEQERLRAERAEQERLRAEQERRQALADILLARFAGLNGELEPLVTALAALPLTSAIRLASSAPLDELLERSSGQPTGPRG